jgi:hypothetical protein
MKLSASVRYSILFAVLWSLLFINLADGLRWRGYVRVTIIDWESVHGWPAVWLHRWGDHLVVDTTRSILMHSDWPWISWPCKGTEFSGSALLVDILVGVVLLLGTFAALRLHARSKPATEYAAWPCVACGGVMILLISIKWDMAYVIAFGWVWLSVGLTLYAVVKHIKLLFNRRAATVAPSDNSIRDEAASDGVSK